MERSAMSEHKPAWTFERGDTKLPCAHDCPACAAEKDLSTVRWFGRDAGFGGVCDEASRVHRPIGKPCAYCDDPIGPDDEGLLLAGSNNPWHHECLIRQVVGSVAHQTQTCSCYGGSGEDDPGISKHEAALRAVFYWRLCHE